MYIQDIPILYINLKRDVTRRSILEHDLEQIGATFKRVDAIYGKDLFDRAFRKTIAKKLGVRERQLHPEFWFNRSNFKTMDNNKNSILSKVGCYLSHLLALKTAMDLGYDKVLILEDDAMPLINAFSTFSIPKNADLFYLGGAYIHNSDKTFTSKKKLISIDTEQFKIVCAFAYIVPSKETIKSIYKLFMAVFLDGKGHDKPDNWKNNTIRLRAQTADFMLINFVQKLGNAYIVNPPMISTREFESNIINNRGKYKLLNFIDANTQYKMIGKRGMYTGLYKILSN
tara:strand:- start:2236 stop:3090 length:855 start_codon:yes stop_codon:yes gene_type:complete